MDWFSKSLFPKIALDVSMLGSIMEEQLSLRMQQLDLIYSQSRILYEIIPHTLRPSADPTKPLLRPHVDGVVSSNAMVNSIMGQLNQFVFIIKPIKST